MICPKCKRELAVQTKVCPYCGNVFLNGEDKETRKISSSAAENSGNRTLHTSGYTEADLDREIIRLTDEREESKKKFQREKRERLEKLASLKKEEQALRLEIQKNVQVKMGNGIPVNTKNEQELLLKPAVPEKKEDEKSGEGNLSSAAIGRGILMGIIVVSYFMGWIGNGSILDYLRLTNSAALLLLYIVPILYGVALIKYLVLKDKEGASWFRTAAFIGHIVGLICILAYLSGEFGMDLSDGVGMLGAGAILSTVCAAAELIVSGFDKDVAEKEELPFVRYRAVLPVINYNPALDFRPLTIRIDTKGTISMEIVEYRKSVQILQADIELTDSFQETYIIRNTKWDGFKNIGGQVFEGKLKEGILEDEKKFIFARVQVKKYASEKRMAQNVQEISVDSPLSLERLQLLRRQQPDTFYEKEIRADGWKCSCGVENKNSDKNCILCGRDKQ